MQSTPNLGARSPLSNGTLVVSLPRIVEVFLPILENPILDFCSNDFEWTVPKKNNRDGIKVDVGSSMKAWRILIRSIHKKEIEKDIS